MSGIPLMIPYYSLLLHVRGPITGLADSICLTLDNNVLVLTLDIATFCPHSVYVPCMSLKIKAVVP